MSGQQDTSGGFARAFVPGLVLGLVIGAFVGATLPPILAGKKLPDRRPGATTSSRDRDRDVPPGGEDALAAPPPDNSGVVAPDEGIEPMPGEDSVGPDETSPPVEDTGPADDAGGDPDDGGG